AEGRTERLREGGLRVRHLRRGDRGIRPRDRAIQEDARRLRRGSGRTGKHLRRHAAANPRETLVSLRCEFVKKVKIEFATDSHKCTRMGKPSGLDPRLSVSIRDLAFIHELPTQDKAR